MIQLLIGLGWGNVCTGLEIVGQLPVRGQDAGVVGRQPVLPDETGFAGLRQLGQGAAHGLDPALVDHQGQQIGVREIPVVVGLLLAAHGEGLVPVRITEPGLLAIPPPSSRTSFWRLIS
jgi:hypothetical protein